MSIKLFQAEGGGIKYRLIKGVKWNMVEAVITATSNFIAAVIAARLLGLDDFGAFSIIRSTVYMMASVAGLGLGITATKYIAEIRNADTSRLGRILGLCSAIAGGTSLCFAGVLLVFAPQIALYNLGVPQITEQLRIAAFYILFVTLNGYQIGALVGFEAFSKLAKINLLSAIVSLAITFGLTWWWGLTGASLALGIVAMFNWLLHHLAIREELQRYGIIIRYRGIWREKGLLTSFAFPAALSGLIGAVTVWICNAFLVRQSDGLAQMAIFTATYNFRSLIMFVPGLVTRVASPILCNLAGENKGASYSRLFWFNIGASAGVSIVVAGFLLVTAPYLLALFGKGFVVGESLVLVVVSMSVVEVIAIAFFQPLYARGKLWWQVFIIICWSIVLIAVTFTTAGDYGAMGLAYAYLAAHIVSATLYVFLAFKIEKIPPPRLKKSDGSQA